MLNTIRNLWDDIRSIPKSLLWACGCIVADFIYLFLGDIQAAVTFTAASWIILALRKD